MNYGDGFAVLLVMLSALLLLFSISRIIIALAGLPILSKTESSYIIIGTVSAVMSVFSWVVSKQVGAKTLAG
jgi:hypothetical protein